MTQAPDDGGGQMRRFETPLLLRLPGFAIFAAVAVASAATIGIAYERAGGSDSETATFADVSGIVITTGPADVEIIGSDRADVVVTMRRTWAGHQPDTSEVVVDRELRLRSSCPHLAWVSFGGEPCRVRYRIEAPTGATVRVDVAFGDVTVDSMYGRLDVNTVSGDVRVRNGLHEQARIASGFGDVTARFATAPRSVEVEVAAGLVSVEVPSGTYDVSTDSATGSTTVEGINVVKGAPSEIRVYGGFGDVSVYGRSAERELPDGPLPPDPSIPDPVSSVPSRPAPPGSSPVPPSSAPSAPAPPTTDGDSRD